MGGYWLIDVIVVDTAYFLNDMVKWSKPRKRNILQYIWYIRH